MSNGSEERQEQGAMDASVLFRGTPYFDMLNDPNLRRKLVQYFDKHGPEREKPPKIAQKAKLEIDLEKIMEPFVSCGLDPKSIPLDLRTIGYLIGGASLGISRLNQQHARVRGFSHIANVLVIHIPGLNHECMEKLHQQLNQLRFHFNHLKTVCPASISVESALLYIKSTTNDYNATKYFVSQIDENGVPKFLFQQSCHDEKEYPTLSVQEARACLEMGYSRNGPDEEEEGYEPPSKKRNNANEYVKDLTVLKNKEIYKQLCVPQKTVETMNWFINQTTLDRSLTEKMDKTGLPGRSFYLMEEWKMRDLGFPTAEKNQSYLEFPVVPRDQITDDSPLIAVDCEMCLTDAGSELTRVALVDEKLNVIYDTLVKPKNKIYDFVTRFSGITEKMLRNIKTDVNDVHREMLRVIPNNAILVGHSIENDLHALKMIHPYVIDTAEIFKKPQWLPNKLKFLTARLLKDVIQENKSGHSPDEDAIASMRLCQLKIEKGPDFLCRANNSITFSLTHKSIFYGLFQIGLKGAILDTHVKLQPSRNSTKLYEHKATYDALVCDHDIKSCIYELSSDHKLIYAVSRGIEETLKFSKESTRIERRVNKTVKLVEKIMSQLKHDSLFVVVASPVIEDSNAQVCNTYLKLTSQKPKTAATQKSKTPLFARKR